MSPLLPLILGGALILSGAVEKPGSSRSESAASVQEAEPATRQAPRPLEDAETRLGPYTLASGKDYFVVVHSKRLQMQLGKFDEAAAWLEIRDAAGAVEYHENYEYTLENGSFGDECSAGARMLAGTMGRGILISVGCEPSAPLSGGSDQVFGLIKGKVIRFGKPLYVEGDMEGFVPGAITKQGQVTMFSPDMLKFKVFTGNIFVAIPLRINWMEGRLEPGMRCYEQSGHGMVESGCEVPVLDAERGPIEQEMTFVRMFPEANEQMIPAHVVVRKDSKVEILSAKVRARLTEDKDSMSLGVDGDVWLKVRIDGKEGWIHTEEDLQAIGLYQSG
jgi:hypothetical protein